MEKTPTFEEALERLESLVEAMEHGQLALEELLERHEEGTRLAALCTEKLAAAEKRIEMITRNAAGEPEVAPFDSNAPAAKPAKPADEVSLF